MVLVVQRDYEYLDSLDTRKLKTNSSNSSNTLRKKKNTRSSWSIFDNYIITLSTASKLNCDTKKASEVSIANIFEYILVKLWNQTNLISNLIGTTYSYSLPLLQIKV